MSTMTADLLPTQPTDSDWRRLGSLVTLERYLRDPKCLWVPQEVISSLWDCRELMDFPRLARTVMAVARDIRFRDVEDFYAVAAGFIDPDQYFTEGMAGVVKP